jgi:hypothetical protein
MADLAEIQLEPLTDEDLDFFSKKKEFKLIDARFLMLGFTPKNLNRNNIIPRKIQIMESDLCEFLYRKGLNEFIPVKKQVPNIMPRSRPLNQYKTIGEPGKPIPFEILKDFANQMGIKPKFLSI